MQWLIAPYSFACQWFTVELKYKNETVIFTRYKMRLAKYPTTLELSAYVDEQTMNGLQLANNFQITGPVWKSIYWIYSLYRLYIEPIQLLVALVFKKAVSVIDVRKYLHGKCLLKIITTPASKNGGFVIIYLIKCTNHHFVEHSFLGKQSMSLFLFFQRNEITIFLGIPMYIILCYLVRVHRSGEMGGVEKRSMGIKLTWAKQHAYNKLKRSARPYPIVHQT